MSESPKSGGELFIVDNSDEAWKGLRYLQDWTEIASAFDIAVTADIPLAARLVPLRVVVIDPRGERLDDDNIGDGLILHSRNKNLFLKSSFLLERSRD